MKTLLFGMFEHGYLKMVQRFDTYCQLGAKTDKLTLKI